MPQICQREKPESDQDYGSSCKSVGNAKENGQLHHEYAICQIQASKLNGPGSLYEFPGGAITNDCKLGGLKQRKFILCDFWSCPKVRN